MFAKFVIIRKLECYGNIAPGEVHTGNPILLGSKSYILELEVYSICLLLFSCSGLMMYTQLISLISVRMCSICYPKTTGAK